MQADLLSKTNDVVSRVYVLIQRVKDMNLNTVSLEQAMTAFQAQVAAALKSHDMAVSILIKHNGFDSTGKVTVADVAHRTVKDARLLLMDAHITLRQAGVNLHSAIRTWRQANIF